MSSANQSQLAYGVEGVWGTSPATLTKVRFTDESLGYNIENIQSNEIRSDRQPTDLIQTNYDASGGVNFELSYGTFDEIMASALAADSAHYWDGVGGGSTVTITAGASNLNFTFNATNNTLTFGASVNHDIDPGQFIEVRGADSGNNGYHLVTEVDGQEITVQSSPGFTTGETLTSTATVNGARLQNGATERSLSIERALIDKTKYFLFSGMIANTFSLNVEAGAIVTGSFDFIGKTATFGATSQDPGGYSEAPSNDVMNAMSNVGDILEGSTLAALSNTYIQSVNFTLNNNIRGINAIGYDYNVDVVFGSLEITGNMNVYFEDGALYAKYLAGTESAFTFRIEDSATAGSGNAYIFFFPRIKFESDTINVTGLNTDVMENLTWRALRHSTYDNTMTVCRFAA